jgi:hypothetical protein
MNDENQLIQKKLNQQEVKWKIISSLFVAISGMCVFKKIVFSATSKHVLPFLGDESTANIILAVSIVIVLGAMFQGYLIRRKKSELLEAEIFSDPEVNTLDSNNYLRKVKLEEGWTFGSKRISEGSFILLLSNSLIYRVASFLPWSIALFSYIFWREEGWFFCLLLFFVCCVWATGALFSSAHIYFDKEKKSIVRETNWILVNKLVIENLSLFSGFRTESYSKKGSLGSKGHSTYTLTLEHVHGTITNSKNITLFILSDKQEASQKAAFYSKLLGNKFNASF